MHPSGVTESLLLLFNFFFLGGGQRAGVADLLGMGGASGRRRIEGCTIISQMVGSKGGHVVNGGPP